MNIYLYVSVCLFLFIQFECSLFCKRLFLIETKKKTNTEVSQNFCILRKIHRQDNRRKNETKRKKNNCNDRTSHEMHKKCVCLWPIQKIAIANTTFVYGLKFSFQLHLNAAQSDAKRQRNDGRRRHWHCHRHASLRYMKSLRIK